MLFSDKANTTPQKDITAYINVKIDSRCLDITSKFLERPFRLNLENKSMIDLDTKSEYI